MQSALTARAIAPPPPPPPRAVERHRRRRVRGTRTTTHASSSGRTDGGEDDAPKSSSRDRSYTRRAALAGYALAPASALSFLAGAPPSDAKLELIYDGELQTAYTFPVQLQVIALRGSVATQWEGEFNKTMVGKGKAAVTTAPSPGEMFDELTRTAPPGGYLSPADFIAGRTSSPTIAAPSKKDKKKSKGAPKFAKADVVSVGDEFLAAAVTQGLVLPLDTSVAYNEWYARLPYVWRELGTRDPRTGLPAQPLRPVNNGGNVHKHHGQHRE